MDDLVKEFSNNEKKYIYDTLYDIKQQSELSSMLSSMNSDGSSSSSFSSDSGGSTESLIDELNNEIKRRSENNEMIRDALKEMIMQPQTIMQKSSCGGIVVFDTSDMADDVTGRFQVEVSLDGEEHRFIFKRGV